MQIERSVATSTKPKRRPSYINLSTASSCSDALLSPRTPKSISKSRRSSVVQELLSDSRASSRRNSLANSQSNTSQPPLTPVLLSDSTTSFFQDLALQDDNDSHSSDPRHLSVDDDSIHSSGRPRSSSVTSIITATGATSAPLPSFDVHTLYKIKTTRSSRKLDHFFGETAPHDICIKEIRKEGIKAMLQSKIPLCYFLFHLLEEYSSENLFFFIEIEQYESFAYTSIVQQLATAQHIYNTYLTSKSFFEVNLDDKVRRDVTGALQRKDLDGCFNSAKRAVYTLLESSYMRFLSTDSFQQMVKHCGMSNMEL
ncbi:RGS domain-containing protein [Radiomyces spectabilis]|uniref:RGS domain-containing protein n=1 Tax=Radiomyces spectabilis TaxID=64574 RepID=UPI00221E8243|nr:RGS domain-containing protein [Radiomyces spectabilis]KAI8393364.1 RGS domain-containing protein [Radiomyces spectabilis]